MNDSNPAWDSLTTEQQAMMLAIANEDWMSYSYRLGGSYKALAELGFINYMDNDYDGTTYFLTYRGAMIIPPSLVKGKATE